MSRTDLQGTLREMWETRPARPRDDRQVAGVAAAIARRYDIDPVLVRVGFVVAAFSGIGAALYIAGWILLPDEPADPSAPAQRSRPRGILLVGLGIAAAISLGSLFGDGPDWFFPLIAVAVLLFLLHRSRGDRGKHPATPGAEAPTVAGAAPAGAASENEQATEVIAPAPTPPAWDPLGAAPFAWDLPEPSPAPPEPPKRRLPVTPVTLGLALIAGGLTTVVMLLAGTLTLPNVPVLFGVVLAVLGAGLVVGSFLRAGRGLIPFALVLSALTWALVAAPLDRWEGQGFGELRTAPATVAALRPSYTLTAGEIDLDLRNLDLATPPGGNAEPVRTKVSLGAGDVRVIVPANADVTLTADVGLGEARFGAESGDRIQVTDDLGADGVRSGRPLVLDIEAGAGDVEVQRA
jgi:phage shock protein PspC (stress-responsive transcriptional regulator)